MLISRMIAISSSGKSFRALATYLANGRTGEEQDRVAWSVSRNLPTAEPELAATLMRATAAQSDRVVKPVYHIALSFDRVIRSIDRSWSGWRAECSSGSASASTRRLS
jgi:hypothetical protein